MLKISHLQTLELARLESERATRVADIEANASVRRADMAQMTHEIIIQIVGTVLYCATTVVVWWFGSRAPHQSKK